VSDELKSGMTQGVTATQTVTDAVVTKYAKRIIDVAKEALTMSVNISGDASGAMAACAAAQAAIDGIQGKTVNVDVDLRRKDGESREAYIARLMWWRDTFTRKSQACSGETARRYRDHAAQIQRYIDRLPTEGDAA
jgi:hypothetical protein